MTVSSGAGPAVQRSSGGGLADVIETILDKGLVIDAFVRVSLVGIEVVTIDARIVVASVDTYLRFAQATNRLDLYEKGGPGLPGLVGEMTEGGAKGKTKGVLSAAKETIEESLDDHRSDDEPRRRRQPRRERE